MPSNPLDMIAAQALALRQQADALYLLVESLQARPVPAPSPAATEELPGRERGSRVARSFDGDGAPVMASRPEPDEHGDLRPTFSS